MNRIIVGYVATIGGTVLALLTLASLSEARTNYLATAGLVLMTITLLGIGWYGLRVERPGGEQRPEESVRAAKQREAA